MVHGIYTRSKSKGKWLLCDIQNSPMSAEATVKKLQKHFEYIGDKKSEVAIQEYETGLNIPQMLVALEPYKTYLN